MKKKEKGKQIPSKSEFRVAKEKNFQNPFISKLCVSKEKNIKKRASQVFLDPIQNRALSRSVQLEAVYLEALLYSEILKLVKKSG